MRITSKGQVTIPQEIRERFGFLANTEVDFVVEGETVRLVKSTESRKESRGERLVRSLRGSATAGLSTEQIMALTREP